ncbi:MAG TPA: sulfatase-like hydrolase/transferase, partial [Candidatus Dormibacteraeota bacterium]|nr:sulfatase-like hydrolase/transferase [Candidatus Dormibacteraeota bacterium]
SVVSPRLDALAKEGVRYARAFATAPQCSPSRASLATGMYPHNNGVMGLAHRGFDWELAVPHAAAIFAGAGFESHLFIGQHVTPHPEHLGFTSMHPIDDLAGILKTDKRLYLEVNFEETHRPYPPAGKPPPGLEVPGYLPKIPASIEEMTAVEQTITSMDAAAGRLLDALNHSGRAADAFVVFTTDHGLAMPRAKCTLYDPGIEVALIARWPAGGISGGEVATQMVSNIDVLPTVLQAAGVPVPEGVQGQSLDRGRDAIFAEKTFHSYYDPMRCIRTERRKFIRNFESAFAVEVPADIQAGPIFRSDPTRYSKDRPNLVELYDLEHDPLEQNNLAAASEEEHELSDRLWAWMRETSDPLLDGPIPSPYYRASMDR